MNPHQNIFFMEYNECTRNKYPLLRGHDKSYTKPILKIDNIRSIVKFQIKLEQLCSILCPKIRQEVAKHHLGFD